MGLQRGIHPFLGIGHNSVGRFHRRACSTRSQDALTLGVGLFLFLIHERGQQAAHANTGGTQVGDLVDLEHGVDLARSFQDFLHLIGGKGV